ncbi:DNA polymerase III subunit delta [Patescibacteria group bacterium]|nr:DNA polymerase III subunit delta [Patescibacteria group bacterium]
MILFLYGLDTYRSRQKLNGIIERYKKIHKSGLSFKIFDFKKDSYEKFKDEIRSVSMFKEKKLLIFKNAFLNLKFSERFLKESKLFLNSAEIILFYEEKGIDKKNPLFNFLKKYGKCQEFKLLTGQKLKKWIKKEIENYGTKIEPLALERLINFVGNNLWQLANEIKKLINFRGRKKIETKDVELLVKPKIETDIFKTIDALASRNKKKALNLIHKHLKKGDSPLYLLSMINFQFRNLILIKSCQLEKKFEINYISTISKRLGVHPFVVRKSYFLARKFKIEELKKIYRKIFQVDLKIKTGRLDPQTALDLLIMEV